MDFLTRDLNWLLNEARNDPTTATQIIEALAGRVEALQTQADTARAESLVLRRSGQHQVYLEQIQRLKADLRELRVIHGKGTGALRARVAEMLRKDTRVAGFRLGAWNEGGAGVTVAELA